MISSVLTFADIFVVGIGFDISGAFLLAQGLIVSDAQILKLSASTYGFNPAEVISRIDDRISTVIGVAALVMGFLCQLAGYTIGLASRASEIPSLGHAAAAVVLTILAIGLVIAAHRIALPRLRRRALIEIAHTDTAHGTRSQYPYGAHLLNLGAHMPPPLKDETQAAYAKRVWRVDRIIEGGPHS